LVRQFGKLLYIDRIGEAIWKIALHW